MKYFGRIKEEMKRTNQKGLSLELRLILTFFSFIAALLLAVTLVLFLTGALTFGEQKTAALFDKELSNLASSLADSFGDLSTRSISMSKKLSESLENSLREHSLEPTELSKHPELLEELLAREYDKLFYELQTTKSSGAFIILDATVNPSLEHSLYSKAGLYIKNLEPATVSTAYYDIRFMRGPASIGRDQGGLTLLPQWCQEFNVQSADYYNTPLQSVKNGDKSPSHLYYWCPKASDGGYDSVMYCSVPLIASDDTVMGVCGYEVSSMLFKLQYNPDVTGQNYLFCLLARSSDGLYDMDTAMFSGNYLVKSSLPEGSLKYQASARRLSRFTCGGNSYLGSSVPIKLYNNSSVHSSEQWTLLLLTPEAQIGEINKGYSTRLTVLLFALFVIAVACSVLISKKYLRPIKVVFDSIKANSISPEEKLRIPEIDDLIEFLARQDEKKPSEAESSINSAAHSTAAFESFIENIKTLSVAEKLVFNLYLEGCTAQEIAARLCLSINTIKTHNKRIYMKLNVSSRKELMVYINMMKEIKS